MNEMRLIARGNTAEVYDYGSGMICKLFHAGYPLESIELELRNTRLLCDLQLPVPSCFQLITMNDRNALLYEKIEGTDLIHYLADENKQSMVIPILAKTHKKILSHSSELLPTYKDFIRDVVGSRDMELLEQLEELPDGNVLCHGDFHPGNIMIDDNGKVKVIDFMNLCRGPKEYDIARTYYLVGYSSLPDGMSLGDDFHALRETLANQYLESMGVNLLDIIEYLSVIEKCHNIEISH